MLRDAAKPGADVAFAARALSVPGEGELSELVEGPVDPEAIHAVRADRIRSDRIRSDPTRSGTIRNDGIKSKHAMVWWAAASCRVRPAWRLYPPTGPALHGARSGC